MLDKATTKITLTFTCKLSVSVQSQLAQEASMSVVRRGVLAAQKLLRASTQSLNQYNFTFDNLQKGVASIKKAVDTGDYKALTSKRKILGPVGKLHTIPIDNKKKRRKRKSASFRKVSARSRKRENDSRKNKSNRKIDIPDIVGVKAIESSSDTKKGSRRKKPQICRYPGCPRTNFGFGFCAPHLISANPKLASNFSSILQRSFDTNHFPSDEEIHQLHLMTKMNKMKIKEWFDEKGQRDFEEKKRLHKEHLKKIRLQNERDRREVQHMMQRNSIMLDQKHRNRNVFPTIPLNMDAFSHLDRNKEVIHLADN